MTIYSRIAGTGSYLPEKILTNADLEKMVDTDDQWIRERTGIEERHIAAEGETTSSMGVIAAQRAMEAAGVTAADLDLIILGTTTPDFIFPSSACLIQEKLGPWAFRLLMSMRHARDSCSRWVLPTNSLKAGL